MTSALKWAGFGVLAVAMFLAAALMASETTSLGNRYWVRYTAWLDRSLRALFLSASGRTVAKAQVAGIVLFALFGFATGMMLSFVPIAAIAFAPYGWIRLQQKKRLEAAEAQLPGFLQLLANALRATPNLGSALGAICENLEAPLKEEVDLALKQCKVGSPLEQALLALAARLGSRPMDAAISTLLVGREIGGDLPKILDATAGSLRELFRLECVVRTKTADGRNQLLLVGGMPFIMVIGISIFKPDYFDPLVGQVAGYAVIVVVSGMWLASIALARKVLGVTV
jgi:tight adherence protein B